MSGFYNNWYKVQHPNSSNEIVPMESGGFQKPFFFGGSQVPVNLGLTNTNQNITGKGIHKKTDFLPNKEGKNKQYTERDKFSNIHIPRHMVK